MTTKIKKILGFSENPVGAYFVAENDDGTILAGRSRDTAKVYQNAQAAIDAWYQAAVDNGDHGAWNICYILQGD